MNKKGLLIVVSGPSGAGKGTICKAILEQHPHIQLSVSVTTRPPREGEVDGINYFFKSEEEFLAMVENGEFLEYAKVFDSYYGTPKKYVKDKLLLGQDVILEIDIQGALKVKDKFEEGVFIFIVPPSMKELKRRIVNRGTESQESIVKRFQSAYQELNFISRYNYVVVNDTIEEATRKIEAIIIAEKCRVDRNREMNIILQGGEIR
jgi:guanylate kinase